MKTIDIIKETFDAVYPYKWVDLSYAAEAEFKTKNNDVVTVYFNPCFEPDGIWNVSFDRNEMSNITQGGDQYRIFATVMQIMKDFTEGNSSNIKELAFISTGKSRTSLYSRMLKRFADNYGFAFEYDKTTYVFRLYNKYYNEND